MIIDAISRNRVNAAGVALPTYLVRMTHKEAMALGAKRFAIDEELMPLSLLADIEDQIRTLRCLHEVVKSLVVKDGEL